MHEDIGVLGICHLREKRDVRFLLCAADISLSLGLHACVIRSRSTMLSVLLTVIHSHLSDSSKPSCAKGARTGFQLEPMC